MAKIKDSDLNKIKATAIKLKSLSERGEENERKIAKEKLKELLSKYNIKTFSDLDVKERSFKLADWNDCRVIMIHCILDTVNDISIQGNSRSKELYCKLTDYQYIEVCEKFNHYYPLFVSEKDNFVKAFLISNDLGIVDSENDDLNSDIEGIAKVSKSIKPNRLINKNNLISNF